MCPSLGAWLSVGCPSEVVDDVATLVDFQHGLELGVVDDFHNGRQSIAEMHLDAQVALLYQMEADVIARIGSQFKTEKGVAVSEVAKRQSVTFVLLHLTGRGEQFEVALDVEVAIKIRLERFGWYLSPS